MGLGVEVYLLKVREDLLREGLGALNHLDEDMMVPQRAQGLLHLVNQVDVERLHYHHR